AELPENGVLSISSRHRPGARLYLRVRPGVFSPAVRGVSILRSIADAALLADKEAELCEVGEEDRGRAGPGRHRHRRSLLLQARHLHPPGHDAARREAALLGLPPQPLAAVRAQPRRAPRRWAAERPAAGAGGPREPADSGHLQVLERQPVRVDTGERGAVVLRPLGASLLGAAAGVLLAAAGEVLEGAGLRRPRPLRPHAALLARAARPQRAGRGRPRGGEAPLPEAGAGQGDCYDVFWEGFAKAMPPAQQLVARVRRFCMQLHERGLRGARGGGQYRAAPQVVEASRGNVLECLNIVLDLDHLDYHHLDRMLRTTG
ncbi:unnamed protein product, partial [Prorocentrum cordatum]